MNIRHIKLILFLLSSFGILLGFSSCSGGDTDGGSASDDASEGTPFVSDNDAGVEGTINITGATLLDTGGSAGGLFIDLVLNPNCDGDPVTIDPEPYFFTQYSVTVQNKTALTIFIDSVDIKVFDSAGNTMPKQSVTSVIAPGASGTFISNFADIPTPGSTKVFAKTLTPLEFGTFSVRFKVSGSTEFGETFSLSRSITATFGAIDRCE
jgi:hypothetical protein